MNHVESSSLQTMRPTKSETHHELVMRIRKLRWIGKEDEAIALQKRLAGMTCHETVLVLPADTD